MSDKGNTRLFANRSILSKEAIEKAQDIALKLSNSFANNEKAHSLDKKMFTRAEGSWKDLRAQKADGKIPEISGETSLPESALEQQKVSEKTAKAGLVDNIKADAGHTRTALSEVGDVLSGKTAADAAALGKTVNGADSIKELKDVGGRYLEKMGHGNKTLGGAKVAAYMVGASMLVDMLNPFDDD